MSGIAVAQTGPTAVLYVTTKTERGGKSELFAVQGTNVIGHWISKHGAELGIAVNDTVRTLGSANFPAPGDVGAEYTLQGSYTGTDYPFPVSSPNAMQFLDGASDGLRNYACDLNANDVWQFDGNWANGVKLFHIADAVSRSGITWDALHHSLWFSGFNTGLVEERSLAGVLLSSFAVPHTGLVALSMDPADGTIWFLSWNTLGTLYHYSRTGQSLAGGFCAALATNSVYGGEFQLPPQPAQLSGGMGPGNQWQLTLNGVVPGRTNVLQTSPDLNTWTAIATNTAVSNSITILTPALSGPRFFRTFEIH
jgi:hypothetical protein